MAIVTSEIVFDEPRGDGYRNVRYKYTFHTGEEIYHDQLLADGVDANADMLTRIPVIEEQRLRSEIDDQYRLVYSGDNPDKVPPDHQTQAEFDRRLLAKLMQERSTDALLAALPFWDAFQIRGGNNVNARADYLGVPRPEYDDVRFRFGDMKGVEGGVTNVNNQVWDEIPSSAWS